MSVLRRVYYGWYVLAVAALGGLLSAGSSQLMMGALLAPIAADTGWSHTTISGALLLGTLGAGLVSPLAGAIQDRRGPRLLIAGGGVVLAVGFLLIGAGASVVVFYAGYALARSAAQGVLGGAAQRAIAVRWFRRLRGRAMGIVTMSVPLGSAGLALAAQWALVHGYGWRGYFVALGVVTLLVLVIPALAILRPSPEAMGLHPDGDAHDAGIPSTHGPLRPEPTWAVADALRTRTLRLIFAGSALSVAANGALVFYQVTFLISRGVGSVTAVSAACVFALAAAGANLVWGVLAERLPERGLAIVAQLLAAASVPGFLLVHDVPTALVYSAVVGILVRGEGSVISLVIASYFGRATYGRITGILGSVQIMALGAGPLLASLLYDTTGSFTAMFAAFGVLYVTAALLYALARPPVLRAAAGGSAP